MRVERSFRGISVRLALKYMESVGAETVGEDYATGEGWHAELSAEKVQIGPSLELTEVTVVFEGEEAVLDELVPQFSKKAIRAGG
ncbi:MAG: hypothetical protein U5K70_02810 [Halodesulfurarchaeum sp.]|nr:hypothetical protein [Halodesulfurarchaeum sp.]